MPDEHEQNVLGDIARVGWSVIIIPTDDEGPGFAYSVGIMHTLDHPELIMFGLDGNVAALLINAMGDMVRDGRRFDAAGLYEGIIDRYACKCLAVAARWHEVYLGYAMWHRRQVGRIGTLEAVQCLWPDRAGLFPDEPGCDPAVVRAQPLLSRR
jgi:hypothetical protein